MILIITKHYAILSVTPSYIQIASSQKMLDIFKSYHAQLILVYNSTKLENFGASLKFQITAATETVSSQKYFTHLNIFIHK